MTERMTMTDLPIIFSGPMIRALLDGRKSMTRRMAWKVAPVWSEGGVIFDAAGGQEDYVEPHFVVEGKPTPWQRVTLGDRLWVRESLTSFHTMGAAHATCHYPADHTGVPAPPGHPRDATGRAIWKWDRKAVPSIHMPRWASRLTLIVTATKIERLQEISREDEIAEGTPPGMFFDAVWSDLHGDASWNANPEIVCLSFTVHKFNIDALQKAHAA